MLHINSCIHIVSEDDFNVQLGWLTFLYDSEVILSTTTGPPSITFFFYIYYASCNTKDMRNNLIF